MHTLIINTPAVSDADFETLTQYTWILNMAKNDYVTGLTEKIKDDLFDIYNRYGFHISNRNCSSCVLSALRDLGNMYDNEVKKRNEGISVEDAPTKQPKEDKKTNEKGWKKTLKSKLGLTTK